MAVPPPDTVLRAFGAAGPAVPIAGGRGTSWRAGALVLKPVEDERMLRWLHETARPRLRTAELRIGLSAIAADGAVVVDGWGASLLLHGERPVGRWQERADVARRFAAAFADVDPRSLPRREDPWAHAERAAWGEDDAAPLRDHPLARGLAPAREPVAVVHADLAGNTLLHPSLPPAVIDLSVTARPVEWSVAVLAVDLVAFEAAPIDLLGTLGRAPGFAALLARALLFRMTTDLLLGGPVHPAYARVEGALLAA